MNGLYPSTCPLHGVRLVAQDSPLGGGLRRLACPEAGCVFVTPSFAPPKERRAPRQSRRRPAVGAGRSTWGRGDYWKDRDER